MLRTLLRRVVLAALAAGIAAGVGSVPASAGPADYLPAGYYKKSYSDTIFKWTLEQGGWWRAIDYAQWEAEGFPEPEPLPTSYVKYAWAPTIHAVSFLDDLEEYWIWERLTPEMWERAGKPVPEIAGWVQGSEYHRWDTSPELFVTEPGGSVHKLTAEEWRESGHRAFEHRANMGFTKLSWDQGVNFGVELDRAPGKRISYESWRASGSPTPRASARFPGDSFHRASDTSPVIIYSGPTMTREITYDEWVAAGKPVPEAPLR
ncbi:hypothetical protein ACOBQX_24445 [Actinokineospora sp. G85]|uniref:hypothetical protein n=1 Tax=Actinokineospora sp. G85 TaxID=3406626 RepID=UPI003C74A8E9